MTDERQTALTRRRDAAVEKVGGAEALYEFVEAGLTLREIADVLGLDAADYNTRRSLYQVMRRDLDRYDEARRASVAALEDQALELLGDDPPKDSAEATWRTQRGRWAQWLADRRDPRKGGINVNVDIGQLHLEALQDLGHVDQSARSRDESSTDRMRRVLEDADEAVDADYEIQEEDQEVQS